MSVILISIDHKWRDLPGYVYAGYLLESRGHEVHYVRNGLERFYVPIIKPDLMLMVHLYAKEKQGFARNLKSAGVLVALMPTEGIPTLKGFRKFASGVEDDLSGVDIHFVWNKPMKETLSENKTIDIDHIIVTGVPRFDFYKEPLKNALIGKEEFCKKYDLNPDRPIITLATNFTQASFFTQNKDFFLKDATRLGYKKVLESLIGGDASNVPKSDYESREIVVNAFVRLIKEYPGVNFLLKLHPSEDHQYYHKMLNDHLSAELNRVRILSNEYIWDVLNVTDIELKRSCTTGVEAWMLDKPTIEVKLNPNEWYFSEDHAAGSDVVSTYEELKSKIDFYLNGGEIDHDIANNRLSFINKWCERVDGNATVRMVDEIDNLLKRNKKEIKIKSDFRKSMIGRLLRFSDWWLHDVRAYGFKNKLARNYVDKLGRTDKQFHDADVAFWNRKISKALKIKG